MLLLKLIAIYQIQNLEGHRNSLHTACIEVPSGRSISLSAPSLYN